MRITPLFATILLSNWAIWGSDAIFAQLTPRATSTPYGGQIISDYELPAANVAPYPNGTLPDQSHSALTSPMLSDAVLYGPEYGTQPEYAAATDGVMHDDQVRMAQAPSLGPPGGLLAEEQVAAGRKSDLPPGTRAGFFQKAKLTATWMPQIENDSIGVSDLRTSVVFGVPFFRRETPLVLTPGYRVQALTGPIAPDVPPRLHDATFEFRHFRRLNDRWLMDISTTLGVYADDDSFGADDAFRITGRALFIYETASDWKWITGVVYLNNAGATVVPAIGLAYRTETVQYDLVFPRPRAAWLLPGSTVERDERWVYLSGEFGGGIWAVKRAGTGLDDNLQLTEYRLLAGLERKIIGGISQRYEIGYVFGRTIEYDSTPGDVDLDDTLLFRVGLTY